MSAGKKKHTRRKRMAENRAWREEQAEKERELQECARRYSEFGSGYGYLREASGAADFSAASGKILYEFSDSRTWLDFSKQKRRSIAKSAHGIILLTLAGLLAAWLVVSFIYRMSAEADKKAVALSMLPSLLVVAASVAILIISVLGVWGIVTRFALSHRLTSARSGLDRMRLAQMQADFARADSNKPYENAITVYKDYVCFIFYGNKYVLKKQSIEMEASRKEGDLFIAFTTDGRRTEFPVPIPSGEFFLFNKAFGGKVKTHRTNTAAAVELNDKGERTYGGYTLGSVIAGAVMSCVILVAGVMLTVAHYVWIHEIPPFLGLFFVGGAGLAFCNTFSHIPFIKEVGVPLVFSVILTVFPPWMMIWIEGTLMGNEISLLHFILNCTPYAAGLVFLSTMGVYAFCFALSKAADFMRFGSEK